MDCLPFFPLFLLQKLLDRVRRKWANPSLKDDDASARMMSRVCNNINQTVVLNSPLWFMLLQTQRLSEGTNTNKSLCRTPLKRKKKIFHQLFFPRRVLITFHSCVVKGWDISAVLRSLCEGWLASGEKSTQKMGKRKGGEKKGWHQFLLPTIIGSNAEVGNQAPVARQPSPKLSIYKPSSK